jgi:hypothetical protein
VTAAPDHARFGEGAPEFASAGSTCGRGRDAKARKTIREAACHRRIVIRRPRTEATMDRGAAVSKPGKKVEIWFAPEMGMHIDSHDRTHDLAR